MGHGDELMAMGQAEALHRATGLPVRIVDLEGRPRISEVWKNHPAIASDAAARRVDLINEKRSRPYISAWSYADGSPRIIYSGWKARENLGTLNLTAAELEPGRQLRERIGQYVVIEPNVGGKSSPNKDWGFHRFQQVVRLSLGRAFVQLGTDGTRWLASTSPVKTESFRAACGILANAAAYVGPEGGLHHAAAALRVPAVVVFGSFISPETTGYQFHVNLTAGAEHAPCGRWAPCDACREALDSIAPSVVAGALNGLLRKSKVHQEAA